MGRDQIGDLADLTTEAFQSTRPVWGATQTLLPENCHDAISIHAPRVGRDDLFDFLGLRGFKHFNPRAPCGARPHITQSIPSFL